MNLPPLLEIEQVEIDGVSNIPKYKVLASNGAKIDVKVQFNEKEKTNPKESWIALYEFSSSDRDYIEYKPCEPQTMTYTFTLPRKPSKYQIRYFNSEEYESVSISNVIESGPLFKFDVQNLGKEIFVYFNQTFGLIDVQSGYIGLFSQDSLIEYKNVDRSEAKITFPTPKTAGSYQVKMIWEGNELLKSQEIFIEGEDKMECFISSDYIHCKVDITSFDPFWSGSWIGLYNSNEKDVSIYLNYYNIRSSQGDFSFGPLTDFGIQSDFEVKLFQKFNSTVPLLTKKVVINSEPIESI